MFLIPPAQDDPAIQHAARLLAVADAMRQEGWGHNAARSLRQAAHDLIARTHRVDADQRLAA